MAAALGPRLDGLGGRQAAGAARMGAPAAGPAPTDAGRAGAARGPRAKLTQSVDADETRRKGRFA